MNVPRLVVIVGLLAFLAWGAWWVWRPTPPVRPSAPPDNPSAPDEPKSTYVDQLCVEIERLGLRCPRLLGSPSILEGGAIVQLARLNETPPERVSIPSSWLLRPPCLLPGVTLPEAPEPAKSAVSIPTSSYRFEGNLTAGLSLRIPRFEGFELTAGPQINRVRRVDVSAERGWLLTLGEDAFARLLADCSLSTTCVTRIKEHRDHVVNNVLVAEGVSYTFFDDAGRKISLQGALAEELFKVGGTVSTTKVEETRLVAEQPVVVGVTLMRDDVITQVVPCDKTVVYTVDGRTTTVVSGGGGEGRVPPQSPINRPFGQMAEVQVRGTESSECATDFERTVSTAMVRSILERGQEENALRVRGDVSIGGGHYATVAGCIAGRPVGWTGHDTSLSTTIQWQGTIHALLRRELPANLLVSWSDMPAGSVGTVLGPRGEILAPDFAFEGNGERALAISSPGMYQVRANVTVARTASGASRQAVTIDGAIRARVQTEDRRGAVVANRFDRAAFNSLLDDISEMLSAAEKVAALVGKE